VLINEITGLSKKDLSPDQTAPSTIMYTGNGQSTRCSKTISGKTRKTAQAEWGKRLPVADKRSRFD
jgi:hypothetical protein